MANPIKETPTLYGKDAEKFSRKMKENENKKVSKTEYLRAIDNYNKIKKHAKIDF